MKIKIQPLGDQIQIKIEQASLGALDTSSMKTGVEWGEIVGIGPEVKGDYKIGDKIFCKAWAVDSVLYDGTDYYFTSEARKGICAKIS